MSPRPIVTIPDSGMLGTARTRRDILRLVTGGGSLVLLPAALAACSDSNGLTTSSTRQPHSGSPLTIDFAKGDIALLQLAYVLEQLEAEFYTHVVDAFGSSNLTAADKDVLQDIKHHEVLHREFFRAALGASNDFTVATTYSSVNFSDRTSVLTAAKALEDLGVAAYNGAGQYITSGAYLTIAAKMVSVEARHASAISHLLNPQSSAFAPNAFDHVLRPMKVAAAAQGFVVNTLGFANAPTSFVQGPNNNG